MFSQHFKDNWNHGGKQLFIFKTVIAIIALIILFFAWYVKGARKRMPPINQAPFKIQNIPQSQQIELGLDNRSWTIPSQKKGIKEKLQDVIVKIKTEIALLENEVSAKKAQTITTDLQKTEIASELKQYSDLIAKRKKEYTKKKQELNNFIEKGEVPQEFDDIKREMVELKNNKNILPKENSKWQELSERITEYLKENLTKEKK